jgi:hypothetical protein
MVIMSTGQFAQKLLTLGEGKLPVNKQTGTNHKLSFNWT